MQQEKISKYGYGFQLKIITSIMTDATFTSQVFDLLKTDYFESESIKFLVDRGLEYFKQQKKIPTLEVYKVFIETIGDDLLKQEIIGALRTATQYVGANDLEFIKETTLDFCKNQAIRSAILESVDYLKMGNYDEIKRVIDKAMRVGLDSEIGLEYFDNIDRRYEENSRDPISTGWDTIDEMMKGGLAAGELGVCIAPSGAGKCVGGNTEIEIEYEEIGINLKEIIGNDVIVWLSPWDEVEVEGRIFQTHDLINLFSIVSQIKKHKNL